MRIRCTADSGAVDTGGPEHVARHIATVPNDAPRAGIHFAAANGTPIYNMGEKKITGNAENVMKVSMTMQAADVQQVLASTAKVCDAGNMQTSVHKGRRLDH